MENQHRRIKGYGELTEVEIHVMNQIKEVGVAVGLLVNHLRSLPPAPLPGKEPAGPVTIDRRWLEEGTMQLQQGLMSLTRSVAKPGFF
jgi:hypothetical protein